MEVDRLEEIKKEYGMDDEDAKTLKDKMAKVPAAPEASIALPELPADKEDEVAEQEDEAEEDMEEMQSRLEALRS